jgi:hypothetical protein
LEFKISEVKLPLPSDENSP